MVQGRRVVWTAEMDDVLRSAGVAGASRRLGVSWGAARARARDLGLPVGGRGADVVWTEEMDADLARLSQRQVARKWRVSLAAVNGRRRRLGLTPAAAAPPDRGRDAEVRRLREGGMLLREIAQELGVSKERVRQILARGGDS